MSAFGNFIGMLRAKSFLKSLGKCEWKECKSPDLAIPMASLFKCGCGCSRTMCRPCVISHNLAISRMVQMNHHLKEELKAKTW